MNCSSVQNSYPLTQIDFNRGNQNRGFTLVEILVAVAIFSILAAMGYEGLSNILSLQSKLKQTQMAQQDLQRALLIMSRDFYQIVPRPVRNNSGEQVSALDYDSNSSIIEFTKSGNVHPINPKQSQLQRIGYALEGDTLYRQHWSSLDRPQSATVNRYAIMKGVNDLSFRFMSQTKEWSNFWEPRTLIDLPLAIEVTVSLEDEQSFLHTFPILQHSF